MNESLLSLSSDVLKEILGRYLSCIRDIVRLDSAVNNKGLRNTLLELMEQTTICIRFRAEGCEFNPTWLATRRIRLSHMMCDNFTEDDARFLTYSCSWVLHHLQTLQIRLLKNWNHKWWRRFIKHCKNLTELRICEEAALYTSLKAVAKCCPKLETLSLIGDVGVIDLDNNTSLLAQRCRALKEVHFINCRVQNLQNLLDSGVSVLFTTYDQCIYESWKRTPNYTGYAEIYTSSCHLAYYAVWFGSPPRLDKILLKAMYHYDVLSTSATCLMDYFMHINSFWIYNLILNIHNCGKMTRTDVMRAIQLPNVTSIDFCDNSTITSLPTGVRVSLFLKYVTFSRFTAITMDALVAFATEHPDLPIITNHMPQIVEWHNIRALRY